MTATSPPPSTEETPTTLPLLDQLEVEALRAAILADEAPRGLTLLEEACPAGLLAPEAARWAAALVWLSADRALAETWVARAPEGPDGAWLRAAGRVAGGVRPSSMDDADAMLRDVEDAARDLDDWSHGLEPAHADQALKPIVRLQRAAETIGRSAAGPVGLAAGVRAQRRFAALFADVVLMLHAIQDLPDTRDRTLKALEAGVALAQGSRPGLVLRALAVLGRGRTGPPPADLTLAIDALPEGERHDVVRGLFGGVWLVCAAALPRHPDDEHLAQVRVRWSAFGALARAEHLLGATEEEPTSTGCKLDFLLQHAMNWRSEALFLRALDARGTEAAERTADEAHRAAMEIPTRTHWATRNQGRTHLLRGDVAALTTMLVERSQHGRSDWFVALRVERAVALKDAVELRRLLLTPGAQVHPAFRLWLALLAAFDGDHAGARGHLAEVKEDPDMRLPWRGIDETRALLEALRDGRWVPDGRPFLTPGR